MMRLNLTDSKSITLIKHLNRAVAAYQGAGAQTYTIPYPCVVGISNRRSHNDAAIRTEVIHLTVPAQITDQQTQQLTPACRDPRLHYCRADHEGRTLLHELFAAAGDI